MKIALPTDGDKLEDEVAFHFGWAKNFLVYDTKTKQIEVLPNPEVLGLKELPPEFLKKKNIDAVIVYDLGPKAFDKFKEFGIKVYKAFEKSIAENIKGFQAGKLKLLRELARENN